MSLRPFAICGATLLTLAAFACSEDSGGGGGGGTDAGADSGALALEAPAVPCSDAADAIYGDPGALPAEKGAIIKCTKDADLSKEAIQAKLTELGYSGKAITSGAKVYRVSFRTERGDAANTPAVSSAIVYVPTVLAASKLPVIIGARGSRGQAAACAASKLDPAADSVNPDFYRLAYPLVGAGLPMIVPDLAGYANFGAAGNPPSVYAGVADAGKSTLDGGRAMKKLFPALDAKVVLVGHSQGGHSALGALALSDAYGSAGPISGVAVYAPLWLSQRSWGAGLLTSENDKRPIASSSVPGVIAWYHYTHAELLDGPGEGKKLFKPEAQAAVEDWVKTACWGNYDKLKAVGATALDLFDPTFAGTVRGPAAGIGGCAESDAVCKKWIERYLADRPHLTGAAAQTPLLLLYGGADETIPPDRMRCALDRLKEDQAKLTVCYDAPLTHSSILDKKSDYVADWVKSIAAGTAAPAACAQNESAVTVECATPPPND